MEGRTQNWDRLVELDRHVNRATLVAEAQRVWRAGAENTAACGPKP